MVVISSAFANYNGSGPLGFLAKNATGSGATDGTEFNAAMIDNWAWGWVQELFTREGFTPDGVTEAVGASQIVDAINNIFPPGMVAEWDLNVDPATYGSRYILLNGQGIVRANYPELDANVYVGDGNNAAVAAAGGYFYHADDAAGTIPNTAGVYLILPESRGLVARGLDLAASFDPDGASRFLGDYQQDSIQRHGHSVYASSGTPTSGSASHTRLVGGTVASDGATTGTPADISNLTSRTGTYDAEGGAGVVRVNVETRMRNRSTKFAIKY